MSSRWKAQEQLNARLLQQGFEIAAPAPDLAYRWLEVGIIGINYGYCVNDVHAICPVLYFYFLRFPQGER